MKWQQRLKLMGDLTTEADWVEIIITPEEVEEGIRLGNLQEAESKRLGLNDRSFSGSEEDSLIRSITAKQAEIAVQKFGGGTARIVGINEFHDYPDVGGVNVRYTFNTGYGLMITNRDQGKVPMILVTGRCPNFKLIGWMAPDYAKQWIYKVHQGRCEDCATNYGFLQNMKDHESCQVNAQMLFPMSWFNKELLK